MARGSFGFMSAAKTLTRGGRLYVHGVIGIGFAVLVTAVADLPKGPEGYYFDWLVLAALTAISGSATVKLPSIPASLSVSETFVFTSVLLFGPPAGTLTVALDGLIISLWLSKNRKEYHRLLFNIAAPAISIWVASHVFFYLAGIEPLAYGQKAVQVGDFLFPLLVFTVLFFGINSWMIAFAVALETGTSAFHIWRTNFLWLSLNFFCGASVAALLAVNVDPRHVDLTYLGAVIPLLLALYLTYRTAMGRVEDAIGHLQRVNRLHLATIETLAHAVDAKDQVTHGHIRRVQNLTTQVATALGVSDELQLRAIEASALLHDMGKLAIPEHILNKPGKLTGAEFEKMKLHASIGAEILSSIEFPYPVVPIVRHHHENWDGTGYPDGICGVDIPIGARILSVVDCFDALTSDRPYRPALTTSAALDIVLQRRGSMYDPLVVDTFVNVQGSLAALPTAQVERFTSHIASASEVPRNDAPMSNRHPLGRDSLSVLRLLELFADLAEDSWDNVADLVVHRLGHAVTLSDCAVYLYDNGMDELACYWTTGGDIGLALRDKRMKRGDGVSGWVAANRRGMINSPAALDLLSTGTATERNIGHALSTPLLDGERMVGVFTIYREDPVLFSDADQEILDSIAPAMARLVGKVRPFYSAGAIPTHDYPTAHHLDAFLRRRMASGRERTAELVLLVFQARGDGRRGESAPEMAHEAQRHLRGGDIVFVCDSDTVVCVLTSASARDATGVCQRLAELIGQLQSVRSRGLESRATIVTAPRDGTNLASLLDAADKSLAKAVA